MHVCVTPIELHADDTAVSTLLGLFYLFIYFLRRRCLWSFFLLIHKRAGFGQVLLSKTQTKAIAHQSVPNSPVSLLNVNF